MLTAGSNTVLTSISHRPTTRSATPKPPPNLGGDDHPAAASARQLPTAVCQVSLPQMDKSVESRIVVASAFWVLIAISGNVRPEQHQRQAPRLGRPTDEPGRHVPHRRCLETRGEGSPLALVASDRLMHPAPLEQQRVSLPGNHDRALGRTEARRIKQVAVIGRRQE